MILNFEFQIVEQFSDNFWKTKEQGIDGICEVTYQINELPEYMIRDRPELIPNPELCPAGKYLCPGGFDEFFFLFFEIANINRFPFPVQSRQLRL